MRKNFLSILTLFTIIGYFSVVLAKPQGEGIWAEIHTNKGVIETKLFYRLAPMTVLNFIGLSEGTKEWVDPRNNEKTKKPLYKDLVFHRVVTGFVIQAGDPLGNGSGGPGYTFDDEFHPKLRHDKAGILSMANRGANTNGSQFFITLNKTPHLDDRHSVFGAVSSGMNVVKNIAQNDQLKEIRIIRIGEEAKAFNRGKAKVYAQKNAKLNMERQKKNLPTSFPPVDSNRIPKPGQNYLEPGVFEYILIGYENALEGKKFHYSHDQALKIAKKISRFAQSKGVEFQEIAKKYSDAPHRVFQLSSRSFSKIPVLKQVFYLLPGQVSPPIDTERGIFIFHRIKE